MTRTLSFLATLFLISSSKSSTWFLVGLISISGSTIPVGLISCSAILLSETSTSKSPGVAEIKTVWLDFSLNSSNLSGLLSRAAFNLKPFSTKASFLALSPLYIPLTCGTVICDSSIKSKKSFGKYSNKVSGVSPGLLPDKYLE